MQENELPIFLVVLVFSYCFFAFFSDTLNPVTGPSRRRSKVRKIKYFRYVAISLFVSVSLAILLHKHLREPIVFAATVGLGLFSVMTLVPSIRFFQVDLPFLSNSKKIQHGTENLPITRQQHVTRNKRMVVSSDPVADDNGAVVREEPAEITRLLATRRTSTLTPVTTPVTNTTSKAIESQHRISVEEDLLRKENVQESEGDNEALIHLNQSIAAINGVQFQQRVSSEEYALEQEIAQATAHISDDLTDFDQSIAEADYEAIHPSNVNNDVATPSFEGSTSEESTGVNNFNGTGTESEINTIQVVSKIRSLQSKYDTLTNEHELLKGENAKIQLDLKRKGAAVRKSEAEKDRAVRIKDQAVKLAAMERKKRKLIEIKARKIIMKLKQNSPQLESEFTES